MGTRVSKVRGFGRPNRLIQEMLVEQAMRQLADGDKKKRQQPNNHGPALSVKTRCNIYLAQTGRTRLTPRQERRVAKKSWHHPADASAISLPVGAAR